MDASDMKSTGATASDAKQPVILVVEDDVDLADTYATWLEDDYDVRTAYGGEEAIESLTDDIDIVLLDRRIPDVSGDEVLDEIRARDIDCQVSMLTAVQPDSDIVDLPFEEYLTKPVTREEVIETVEELLLRQSFDEETQEYLALESTEDALDERTAEDVRDPAAVEELQQRVERLESREEVRERVDELERLKRVNSLIRDVNQTLVQASTREEIERDVCDLVVERGPYQFAFVGDYTTTYETLRQRAVSHTDGSSEASDSIDVQGPISHAIETETITTVDLDDGEAAALLSAIDGESFESPPEQAAIIPLIYQETIYGAIIVYTSGNRGVTDYERTVLTELGDTVANAINSVESQKLLYADAVVELEFSVTDRNDVFVDLSAEHECRVTLEGFVPSAEKEVTCYVTVSDAPTDDVLTYFAESDAITNYRGIDDQPDTALFEVTLASESLVLTCIGASAKVETFFVDHGEGTVTVEIEPEADARTVVETIQDDFPDTDFVKKRSHERSFQSTGQFRASLDEKLTERQRTVIEAAYESGYFEWPRKSTAEEVAEALEISSPTLHEHLRQAVKKLAETYLDGQAESERERDE